MSKTTNAIAEKTATVVQVQESLVLIEVDETSGRATSIERISEQFD